MEMFLTGAGQKFGPVYFELGVSRIMPTFHLPTERIGHPKPTIKEAKWSSCT
jgi:hypothetical protein